MHYGTRLAGVVLCGSAARGEAGPESDLDLLVLLHPPRTRNASDLAYPLAYRLSNPGTFHFGITPEKLTRPHESKPWNPIIANVFYRAGIIERWGSGTLNIIDWCKENGNPLLTWQEQSGSVYVTFRPASLAKDQVGTKGTKSQSCVIA